MNRFERQRALAALPLAAAILLILAACDPAPETTAADDDAVYDDAYGTDGVETPTRSNIDEIDAGNETMQPADNGNSVTAAKAAAEAELQARSDSSVSGQLTFRQENGFVRVRGEIEGLTPGVHGMHIHEVGDCSAPDASSAGAHFAPHDAIHGAPSQSAGLHHAGDLGNIVANQEGIASVDVIDDTLTLDGGSGLIGRAIIVHAEADDLVSQPSGNSGDRVACGVIERSGSRSGSAATTR
jgi:Cu-Zn family superoxide dismutase